MSRFYVVSPSVFAFAEMKAHNNNDVDGTDTSSFDLRSQRDLCCTEDEQTRLVLRMPTVLLGGRRY